MKKLVNLILLTSLTIPLMAQNGKAAVHGNSKGKSQPTAQFQESVLLINERLTAVFPTANEHLSYHGVPMDCDAPKFRERLTRIGFDYEYVWNGRYNKNKVIGPLWKDRSDLLNVYTPKGAKLLTGVGTGYYQTMNRALAEKDFRAALVSVIEDFPDALVDYREYGNQTDGKMEKFTFRVVSQQTKHILGTIDLVLRTSVDKKKWSVRLAYIDYNNEMVYNQIKYGLYDLSYLAKPYCESCIVRVDDCAVTFKIRKNGKEKVVIALADDCTALKKVLFHDPMSDYGKQEQLGIYLDRLHLATLPSLCYTNYVFNAKDNPQDYILLPSADLRGIKGFGENLYLEYFGGQPDKLAKGVYGFYNCY